MIQSIGISILVFTAIVLVLVLGLLFARKKLVAQGKVKLILNGDTEHPIEVEPGSSLLSTLANNKIFLPSACGGGGTCAMCECKVHSGGG